MQRGLALYITEHQCGCGNKWTHSQTMLYTIDGALGGTPTPGEELSFPVVKVIAAEEAKHYKCHRCATMGVAITNWCEPLLTHKLDRPAPAQRPKYLTIEDVDPENLV